VVDVDGIDYDEGTTARLARSSTSATHDDVTIRDPGYRGVNVTRRIVFSHGLGWLLVDDRMSSTRTRTYRQLWHLLPNADPHRTANTVRTRQCGANLTVTQLVAPDSVRIVEGRRSPVQGWYSTGLNRRAPAPVIEAIARGRTARYVTVLVPLRSRDSNVRLTEIEVTTGRIRFVITVDGRSERVAISARSVDVAPVPGGSPVNGEPLLSRGAGRADARMVALARRCEDVER
jgi:hypothetical protein